MGIPPIHSPYCTPIFLCTGSPTLARPRASPSTGTPTRLFSAKYSVGTLSQSTYGLSVVVESLEALTGWNCCSYGGAVRGMYRGNTHMEEGEGKEWGLKDRKL